MPPSARKPATRKPPTVEPAEPVEARHAKADGEICKRCWPRGWPETAHSASCVHGQWSRDKPA